MQDSGPENKVKTKKTHPHTHTHKTRHDKLVTSISLFNGLPDSSDHLCGGVYYIARSLLFRLMKADKAEI